MAPGIQLILPGDFQEGRHAGGFGVDIDKLHEKRHIEQNRMTKAKTGGEERPHGGRFSIGFAPLTSITETDTQIRGGNPTGL